MGAVYRATQEPLGREVALKVMSAALSKDAGAIERFQREAKASSSLSHPNIVTVFDFGDDNGSLFLAMELIPGKGLDTLLEHGAMPWRRAVGILRGICAALSEAHAKGIVHRDLKPANVIITSTTTQVDVPKVVDFGIAKLKDSGAKNLTMTGAVVGTPGYVAPELFHGIEPSSAADLYALGVLAFDMLCGRPPFKGDTAAQLLKQHLFDPPPAPSSVMEGLPANLDVLVLSLLEKDPNRRPLSALDVDRSLAAILEGGGKVPTGAFMPLAPSQPTEMAMQTPTPPTKANLTGPGAPSSVVMTTAVPPSSSTSMGARVAMLGGVIVVLVLVLLIVAVATRRQTEPPYVEVARINARLEEARLAAAQPAVTSTPVPALPTTTTTTPPPIPVPPPVADVDDKKPKKKKPGAVAVAVAPAAVPAPPPPAPPPPPVTPEPAPPTSTKRAYLGTVPDHRYRGHGVRVDSVTTGSPAFRANLLPMDILLRIDADIVDSEPGLAIAMSRHRPGDRVRVTFSRAGIEHAVDLTLVEPPDGGAAGRRREREREREPVNAADGLVRDIQKQLRR